MNYLHSCIMLNKILSSEFYKLLNKYNDSNENECITGSN